MLDYVVYIIDSILGFFKPKYRYYKDHRDHPIYKKKKQIVKKVWIGSGIIMIIVMHYFPHASAIGIVLSLSMVTTFLAFMILDETWSPGDDEE